MTTSIKSFDHRTRGTQKLLELGGAVMSSNWKKATPPFCDNRGVQYASEYCHCPDIRKRINEIMVSHPSCTVVYVHNISRYQSERIRAMMTTLGAFNGDRG